MQSSLHVYCVYMGIIRVNEQARWDNKSVLMVLVSQNTYINVDSAEPYGRLTVTRAVTLQLATRIVAEIFVTEKIHLGELYVCVCVSDLAVTDCCSRAAAYIFTVWRIY